MIQDKLNTKEEIQSGKNVGFRHIRRVTVCLTGNVKMMNNAKQSEVDERVKHSSVTK